MCVPGYLRGSYTFFLCVCVRGEGFVNKSASDGVCMSLSVIGICRVSGGHRQVKFMMQCHLINKIITLIF